MVFSFRLSKNYVFDSLFLAYSFLGIRCFDRRAAQQIVYADMVKIGQLVQHGDRNIQVAQFIVGICGLMNIQQLGKFCLRQVTIFTQITDTKLITHKLNFQPCSACASSMERIN